MSGALIRIKTGGGSGDMSESSHESSTESSFTQVINRVWNALDIARRELAMHRDENLLTDTRNAFRRRRRAGRLSGKSKLANCLWDSQISISS